MARSEARIFNSIWRDRDFLALPPGAQRLYFFLLSQDDLEYCGVMPLRVPRWAPKAGGLTIHDVEQELKALACSPPMFVLPDHDTGELMIRSLMRRDGIWKQPNLLKLARVSAASVESVVILMAMLRELRRLPLDETPSAQVKTLVAEFIQDLEQATAYPTAYPSPDPTANPADEGPPDPGQDPTAKDYARAQGLGGTLIPTVSPDPLSPGPGPQEPLSARDRKLGTRLPDDFAVTPDMVTWARKNAPHVDGRRETEQFCDYWQAKPGKDGRKIDWIAAWRYWMRNSENRQGPRDRPAASGRSTTDDRVAAIQALKTGPSGEQADPLPANTIQGSVIR